MESLSQPLLLLLLLREEAYEASEKGNIFILNRRDLSSGSLIILWKKKIELPDPPEFIHRLTSIDGTVNFELKSMEKKEMAEQEAVMKGPGSFPVETLLEIFQWRHYILHLAKRKMKKEKKKLLLTTRLLSRKCLEADDSMFQTVGDQKLTLIQTQLASLSLKDAPIVGTM